MLDVDFGPYEALFRIGAGGMGEVYAARAREPGHNRLVAVKRMFPRFGTDKRFAAMLVDEARIMGCVSHPNVVRILDGGTDAEGSPYLVMEMVVGADLASLLDRLGALPVLPTLEWIAQAADGLHAAHVARTADGRALGLVHRDVSPENVLIGVDGRARIGDFGVAYAIDRVQQSTATGHLKGKLGYMSPEQSYAQELDGRSDVFALGVVAWEALTGEPLFRGTTAPEIIDRVRHWTIPAPHTVRAEIPEGASSAIMRALERNRDQRFATAQAFADALRSAMPSRPSAQELMAVVRNARVAQVEQIHVGLSRTWPQAGRLLTTTPELNEIALPRRGKQWLAVAGLTAVLVGAMLYWLAR